MLTDRVCSVSRTAAVGIVWLALPVVVACDADSDAAAPPVPSSGLPPSARSTSPQYAEKVASDGAIAGYRRWDAGMFRMRVSGGRDTSMLASIATGIELDLDRSTARQMLVRKQRFVSNSKLLWVRVTRTGRVLPTGVIGDATVSACHNVTTARAIDAAGMPVTVKGRPPRLIYTAEMRLVGGSWKASLVSNRQAASC